MVKTSRESFLKVKEAESDLDAISLIGEAGMSAAQVRDAVVKMGGVTSSASEMDNVARSSHPNLSLFIKKLNLKKKAYQF